MTPRHGEAWLADLDLAAKLRPVVVLLAENLNARRLRIIHGPVTRQNRGRALELPLGHLSFLDAASVDNAQGVGSLPVVRFQKRLGALPEADLAAIKKALVRARALEGICSGASA